MSSRHRLPPFRRRPNRLSFAVHFSSSERQPASSRSNEAASKIGEIASRTNALSILRGCHGIRHKLAAELRTRNARKIEAHWEKVDITIDHVQKFMSSQCMKKLRGRREVGFDADQFSLKKQSLKIDIGIAVTLPWRTSEPLR
jgi:hypothetical protein